jgi:hypothetical protein
VSGTDRPSPELLALLASLGPLAREQLDAPSRRSLFFRARALRAMLHDRLAARFAAPGGAADAAALGLDLGLAPTFEVHAARFAERIGPDGQLVLQCIIELLQHRQVTSPAQPQLGAARFDGGSTVVVTLRSGGRAEAAVRYIVRKSIASPSRVERQFGFLESRSTGSLWNTYFGGRPAMKSEPFAVAHRA